MHGARGASRLRQMIVCVVSASASALQPPPTAGRRSAVAAALGLLAAPARLWAEEAAAVAADGGLADAKIAAIPASGLIFKDILNVNRVRDPKVEGVELYVSDFQRGISDRLGSDFFGDPTSAALACAKVGRVRVDPSVDPVDELHQEGEEVFSQAKSLLFRRINVRRLYDKEAKQLLYVTYGTRVNKDDDASKARFRSAMCVVPVD